MSPQSFGNLGAGAALSARESAPTSAQRRPALNASASAPARGDFCPALMYIVLQHGAREYKGDMDGAAGDRQGSSMSRRSSSRSSARSSMRYIHKVSDSLVLLTFCFDRENF